MHATNEMRPPDSDAPPPNPRRVLVTLVAVLAAFLVLRLGWSRRDPASDLLGKPLGPFEVQPLWNADQAVAHGALQGKVSLINYWGPWCGPCRIEMPHLVELVKHFDEETDFQFVSVSCGVGQVYHSRDELKAATATFAGQLSLAFPVYWDPQARNRIALMKQMGEESFSYPTTVLADRQGMIVRVWRGYRPGLEHQIRAAVENALAGRRGDPAAAAAGKPSAWRRDALAADLVSEAVGFCARGFR